MRDHIERLHGAAITAFLTDGITEAWIDFTLANHSFSVNDQCGEFWFFVHDAACPDDLLQKVLYHCRQLLGK